MGETYIQIFEQNVYPEIFADVAEYTIDLFEQQKDKITEMWKGILRQYMEQLILIQKNGKALPVAEMNLSFLYSSLQEEHPKYRIDSYGEGGRVFGDSFLTGVLPADWMVAGLEQLTQNLSERAAKESLRRYIRPAMIETLRLRAVRSLLYYFAMRFKYFIEDMIDFRLIAQMEKAPHFFIQIGEYMDWQKTIYAIRPAIDIFNCDRTADLRFRNFPAVLYKEKCFRELDLSQCVFKDSTFKDSNIKDCIMNDCMFDGCTFENVKVETTSMTGCIFSDCVFRWTEFTESIFFEEGPNIENPQYFEPAEFHECSFDNVTLKHCILIGCPVINCDASKLDIDVDSKIEYSGFAKLVQGTTNEEAQDGIL